MMEGQLVRITHKGACALGSHSLENAVGEILEELTVSSRGEEQVAYRVRVPRGLSSWNMTGYRDLVLNEQEVKTVAGRA